MIEDELLKKYIDTLNKAYNCIKKEFDSKPIYNKKFLKTKFKSYGDEARNFHYKEMPKVGSNYICLAVTLIDFILKKMKIIILKCFQKNVNTLNNIVFFEGVIYI